MYGKSGGITRIQARSFLFSLGKRVNGSEVFKREGSNKPKIKNKVLMINKEDVPLIGFSQSLGILTGLIGQPEKQLNDKAWWCCPKHDDKTPSFCLVRSNDGTRGLVRCYGGCDSQFMDLYQFIQETQGVTYWEAVKRLFPSLDSGSGSRSPIEFKPKQPKEKKSFPIDYSKVSPVYNEFIDYLDLVGEGLEYLATRKLDGAKCFDLGLRYIGEKEKYRVSGHMKKHFSDKELVESGLFKFSEDKTSIYLTFLNRLIIPWYKGKNVIGIQGRALTTNVAELKKYGKYKTALPLPLLYVPKKTQDNSLPVWITEGAMDTVAHIVNGDGRAVGISSKSEINRLPQLAGLLTKAKTPSFVVALDNEPVMVEIKKTLANEIIKKDPLKRPVSIWPLCETTVKDLGEAYALPTKKDLSKAREQKILSTITDQKTLDAIDLVQEVFPGAEVVGAEVVG